MITVLAVGKIKEKYLRDALEDYAVRISRHDKITIKELGEGVADKAKISEGESLLNAVPKGSYVIALDLSGRMYTSEEFAGRLMRLNATGNNNICFIIGGSEGLSAKVLQRADELVSFSRMTFPHQLFRVILLEQIYRAMKINNNETYHK